MKVVEWKLEETEIALNLHVYCDSVEYWQFL